MGLFTMSLPDLIPITYKNMYVLSCFSYEVSSYQIKQLVGLKHFFFSLGEKTRKTNTFLNAKATQKREFYKITILYTVAAPDLPGSIDIETHFHN